MVIAGFQPFSLLDYPGKSCATVFTQGCPFRCSFCHNPDLISNRPQITVAEDSIFRHLVAHRNMLDGVCITGGEPTVQVGLRAFMERIKETGLLVKLDTNGIHPDLVAELFAAKLVDFVAMDLKNRWEGYADVIRVHGEHTVPRVRKTFQLIQESGIPHEFRTTICPGVHTKEDFLEMAGYLKAGETYVIQDIRFDKTLDPNLPQTDVLRGADILLALREKYPKLVLDAR